MPKLRSVVTGVLALTALGGCDGLIVRGPSGPAAADEDGGSLTTGVHPDGAILSPDGGGPSEGGPGSTTDAAPQTDAPPQADAPPPQADAGPPVLVSITVAPTDRILEVDLDTPTPQAFTARGTYSDLSDHDVTAQATWTSSNAALGAFTGSTLNVPGIAAASAAMTTVTATIGSIAGTAQLTVVVYRRSGPQTDFFFILPFQDPTGNQKKPLDFRTNVQSLDVFFAVDTTGSMYGEISNLQSTLNTTIVPQIQAQIPDTQFGAGSVEDFPVLPYGSLHGSDCGRGGSADADQPLTVLQGITSNVGAVQAAVNVMSNGPGAPVGCGQDWPEGTTEALYQIATGEGLAGPWPTSVAANHTGVGGVGYRHGAMPVVLPITDAVFHAVGEAGACSATGEGTGYGGDVGGVAHGRQVTKDRLNAICAKVVGVAAIQSASGLGGADCSSLNDEEDFARATGARVPPAAWDGARPAGCGAGQCCTGFNGAGRAPDGDGLCPLVFLLNPDGTGLGLSIVTGLQMLTRFAAFDVTSTREGTGTGLSGEPLPAPHTTANFIKVVQPVGFQLPPPPPALPNPTMDATSFHNVTPGTVVSFQIEAYNDFVPSGWQPQLFKAVIKILAGGCTELDEREVLILVPARLANSA